MLMMKILLVSDSHNDYSALDQLAAKYPNMDLYLHAGDSEQDEFSIKPFISVRGNCDHYYDFPNFLVIPSPVGNIYIQHTPYISSSVISEHNAKIVIHGHTHTRKKEIKNGILWINPGAINYARDKYDGSYAIITIENNQIDVKFYTIQIKEINMIRNNDNVTSFLAGATELLNTSRQFSAIYRYIVNKNRKNVYAEYYNANSKIKHYKYQKMDQNVKRFASYIKTKIKAEENSRVILKMANSPAWGEVFWAILMSGFVPLLIDAKLPRENVENLAKQSKAIAIISDDNHEYSINKIRSDNILQCESKGEVSNKWANEVVFSSSGTTGDAKLMIFNGENFVHQICCSLDMGKESVDIMYDKKCGKVKILAMIPFHHIFGFVAVFLWYTFYGKTLVFPRSNTPTDLLAICQKVGITHVYSVPLFWDSLALSVKRKFAMQSEDKQALLDKLIKYNLKEIEFKDAGLAANPIVASKVKKLLLGDKVKFCISGGGYLSNDTLRTINGLGYPLYNGYGMTEIGVTSVELSSDVKVRLCGRIGHPLHTVEY